MPLHQSNANTRARDTRFGVTRWHQRDTRTIRNRADLGCAVLEKIAARAGPFWSHFDTYAVILAGTASLGPLKLNGSLIAAPDCARGRYCVFAPGDTLSGTFTDDVVYDVLYLNSRWVEDVIASEVDTKGLSLPTSVRVAPSPVFVALWQRIRAPATSADPSKHLLLARDCVRLLVLLLAEPQLRQVAGRTMRRPGRPLEHALAYIDANLSENLSISEISNVAGLSQFHFCRVFRQATGLSVRRYVVERRLENARHLLATTGRSICDIAHECGFSSQSHFTTAFRTRFGSTPNAYRRGRTGPNGGARLAP